MTVQQTAPTTAPASPAHGPVRRVEDAFAALHGADRALLVPGAVAATTGTLLALTNPGGHLIASDQICDPLRGVLTRELSGLGRTVTFVDCTDVDAVIAAVRPETQVVYTQSLSDPLMRPAPLNEIAIHAQMNDLLLVVDNTALSPAELRPLETGAVVVIEDTAPYLDGWGDVGAALVTGLDRYLPRIAEQCARLGGEVHGWAAHLLERSLATLQLRLSAQRDGAERVAAALRAHPAVRAVHRPSFDEAPWALETHEGFGGLLSFEVVPEIRDLSGILAAGNGDGTPLAGSARLPAHTSHAHLSERVRREAGITRQLVRLEVGITGSDALTTRLRRALDAALEQSNGADT
ncbi:MULTISPECIES: PLP-dependent transferase [unclassified Streptomyces]|uniref:PLP-dependent transferase n=1 Tax=unclassified Streptomyces TaxID=2593676 RepID=UPI00088F9710|nr:MULTISPECIES: PLP-dependent transferase [unclassified Streptomyces]PBC84054.1 cystathionine gamma-lyase/cystathionine beta-lyase/cystathionine gamma-lyase/homocysteine desulfhydrase [Streptomyces sp. 2321.6]SDR35566.1 cystathionine gamma-lyase/cystathionine beta-lyase/cystathionine gamma-lyase / homocysteine desulfhydrase [Streptomyces sp. KS_16]SED18300.1 cystathionine gamma-lyase/cystathionine beta-lyase/cystathionine gamma-lyase / homocysteine desulfhydrase [Streptomyces sp. 2133.1]SNC701